MITLIINAEHAIYVYAKQFLTKNLEAMKKILLLCLLIASVSFVFAQFPPCPVVASFKGNNGGGNCDPLPNGDVATGTITVCFTSPVTVATAPSIVSLVDLSTGTPITDLTFILTGIDQDGCAEYCYYVGGNKINNLFGDHHNYSFGLVFPPAAACSEQSPLPVNFKSFTAARNKSLVTLKWTTASESNNLGFEIQRLIGSGSWQTVSFVYTQAIGGNSGSELSYSYSDVNSTKGVSQYRIRQVDIDQKSKFSEIRAVRGDGQNGKIIVYPNPAAAGGKINVVFEDAEGTRDASLIDINGRLVKQWKNITNNNLQIENVTPGLYNLKVIVRETGEQTIEKIVVNKN